MARKHVESFIADYAADKKGLKGEYKSNRAKAVKDWDTNKELSDDEKALLVRGDSHEIKDYLKDSYAASLSINIP